MNQTEFAIIKMVLPATPPSSILSSHLDFTTMCLTLICFLMAYRWIRRPRNFPPGPRGVPILGVIPFIGSHIERTFRDWGKQYGPVMAVRLGRKDFVILNNLDVIKQVIIIIYLKFITLNCSANTLLKLLSQI